MDVVFTPPLPLPIKGRGRVSSASRDRSLKVRKGTRSAGHPSGGLDSDYRFDEARRSAQPLSGEPSTRGVLTRFRKRPPAGGPRRRTPVPERPGDFSPDLSRRRNPRRQGFVLCFKEPAAGSAAKTPSPSLERPASASRSTTPDSRHDRRPDVPSKPSGKEEYEARFNADHRAACKSEKRLKSLGSIPSMRIISPRTLLLPLREKVSAKLTDEGSIDGAASQPLTRP